MRKLRKGVVAAVLAIAMLIGCGAITTGFAADTTVYPDVSYRLYITGYELQDGGVEGEGPYTITLGLYVYYANNTSLYVSRGAFGLRFPENMEITFTPDSDNVELYPIKPTADGTEELEMKAPGQHFISWVVNPMASKEMATATKPKDIVVFGETVELPEIPSGIRMRIGTYSLTVDKGFPTKNAIGQLDWLTTELSQDPLYSTTEDGKSLNAEVWNDTDGDGQTWYQGHHAGTGDDLEMYQIDLPLYFPKPAYWPNAFTILSYDPKKPIELNLYDDAGNLIAHSFTVPLWEGEDTNLVYAATEANENTGVGPYYTAIDLDVHTLADGQTIGEGTNYVLEIHKDGHLVQKLSLTLPGSNLSEAEGLPENGGYLYLPAGDINPIRDSENNVLYGDGRIDMADRAQVLCRLGAPAAAKADAEPASYYADIDGDGRITIADLSILISPQNYGQNTKQEEGY